MKDLTVFLKEQIENAQPANITEGEVKSEKDFREYAEKKLKEVHGDDYKEDKAKELIDGILNDHKKEVDDKDWGTLVGILNKSCTKE